MRMDKFLKVTGIIKRRSLANTLCEKGCVKIDERLAKSSTSVKKDSRLDIYFNNKLVSYKILQIPENKNSIPKVELDNFIKELVG